MEKQLAFYEFIARTVCDAVSSSSSLLLSIVLLRNSLRNSFTSMTSRLDDLVDANVRFAGMDVVAGSSVATKG